MTTITPLAGSYLTSYAVLDLAGTNTFNLALNTTISTTDLWAFKTSAVGADSAGLGFFSLLTLSHCPQFPCASTLPRTHLDFTGKRQTLPEMVLAMVLQARHSHHKSLMHREVEARGVEPLS